MKRTILLISLVAVSAFAQNMPKPDLYVVHEEIVKPGAVMSYEAVSKDFIAALAEKSVSSPAVTWNALSTPDMHYIYLQHIDSFAALDSSQAEWGKARTTVGAARWDDLMNRSNVAMEAYNETVVTRRPDLSYAPANPRVAVPDRRYFRLEFYYLIPGKEKEAEQVAKDYAALFKAKNITDSWNLYQGILGTDLPVFIVAIPAKSEADLVTSDQQVNAALGADVRPLQARAMAVTRRFERREGMLRPDLSYPAMTATK